MGCNRSRPTVVGVNQHAPPLVLQGPHASFDSSGLMMRIYSRVCEALSLGGAVILPLATGKYAIVCMIVLHIYSVCQTVLLESSLGRTYVITILVRHQVNIAKIRIVVNEHRRILVSLSSEEAAHLRNETWGR